MTSAAALRIGFIGLGDQGAPMARRIVEAGYETVLWARNPDSLAPFADTAATNADTPAAMGKSVDIVCVCVLDDAGLEEVVAGPQGLLTGMQPGGIIVVHSTVLPDTCLRLADLATAAGVTLLDAPVSGGGTAAAERRLLVMIGGDERALERSRPVLETYGNPVVLLGPVGAGQRAKLLNNLLLTANLAVAESAYRLGRDLSVDPQKLSHVLAHGSGSSFAAGMLPNFEFTVSTLPDHTGALLQKDARLLVELADAAGVELGAVLGAADAALELMRAPR